MTGYLGSTYDLACPISKDLLNNPEFYELKFSPIYDYESELNLSLEKKVEALNKIINHLHERNIYVTFTDRIYDDEKSWERKEGENWRYLPIAELQGNNICINVRNIDFLSILFSIGHIYGHLVQRMDVNKYKPITDFVEMPKPLNLEFILSEYTNLYGRDYKTDFWHFEIEAFQYAKYTFLQAGIEFNETFDDAINVYIEADFNELWKWVTSSPQKSGESFMDEFIRLWKDRKGKYKPLEPKEINVRVIADPSGSLVVVRDGY